MIFNMTGGGAPLNFKVVPNPQPDTAKENTIWVDTDRINNYYFSATQPEGMVDYDVWFPVGTSSTVEFNALKKGGIQVYPLSAQQMVSGVLKDVTAKSYQGGVWKEWIEVIDFDLTNWKKKNPYPSRSYTQGTYDLSSKTLKGSITKDYQYVVLVKNEKMNFQSANTLNMIYSISKNMSSNGAIFVKLSSSFSDPADNTCVVNQQITEQATNKEISIDVSSVNSSYYLWIGLVAWGNAGTVNFEISKLHIK